MPPIPSSGPQRTSWKESGPRTLTFEFSRDKLSPEIRDFTKETTMEVDDSRFILDLNQRVLRNKENGLALNEGISDTEFQRFLSIMRGNRATASSVGGGTKSSRKKVEPMKDDTILNLFN
jgi:hypothetical protein